MKEGKGGKERERERQRERERERAQRGHCMSFDDVRVGVRVSTSPG